MRPEERIHNRLAKFDAQLADEPTRGSNKALYGQAGGTNPNQQGKTRERLKRSFECTCEEAKVEKPNLPMKKTSERII